VTRKKARGGKAARARQQQEAAARRRGARAAAAGKGGAASPAAASPEAPGTAPRGSAVAIPRTPRHYLDVSAVRIQEWLGRTPALKFRRGGSVLLTEATARDEVENDLPEGVMWNEQAGGVNGVVSLVLSDGTQEPERLLNGAARHVADCMRAKMPHIHIQAVTGTGETYAAAYQQMAKARRDGRLLLDLPPAPQELILAKPCDQCRSAAAIRGGVVIIAGEEPQALCGECDARFRAAGGTEGDDLRRSPLPEQRMKTALADVCHPVTGFSDNFAKMAAAGHRSADDAAAQLALIYADGNRVGTFLHEAAASGGAGPDKSGIVRMIDDAAIGALADAVAARFPGWDRPPVLAHIAGGDDLLISVPAADGWLFTRTLLAAFDGRTAEASRGWPLRLRQVRPSLSAGLVFHHRAHPFSDLVRIAESELRKAKSAGQGKQAMVSFLDLTADGGAPPPGRQPLTLAYLDQHAGSLERAEQIPRSRRQALLALLRQDAADDLIRRLTDLDNRPLWDVIAGQGAGPEMVRGTLRDDPGKRGELRRLLDIARHWATQPRRPGSEEVTR
jgi:hypothetical protein